MNRLALVSVLFAISAWAQTDRVIQEPDRTVVRMKTQLDLGAVEVEGGIKKPVDSYVMIPRAGAFANRIKVRGDFVPELQKSVDSL